MKLKKKVKKFPNGGRAPIKGTKEQYQAYQDSLTLYKSNSESVGNTEFSDAYKRIAGLNGTHPNDWVGISDGKYQKPVQPIIYQPEEKKKKFRTYDEYLNDVKKLTSNYVGSQGMKDAYDLVNEMLDAFPYEQMYNQNGYNIPARPKQDYQRPKEQPINIQSFKPDLLQGSDINMFNPIPFEKGTYFTRKRQNQEQDSKQFGRKGKTDYFDKKTGKLMGTYANGGSVNRYDVPAQMPIGQKFFELPYNELATALMSKQKAYDIQEAEIAKNQAFLADLKNGYRTAGLPQEIQQEYNSKFENYIGQDLADPTVKRSLVQDFAALKGDPRLRTLAADIKQSAMWDNYRQAHPDLAKAAVNPYNVNGQWIPAKDAQGNWQTEQQLGDWYGNITPYADTNKFVDDLYGKVKENTKQTIIESNPSATFHIDPVTQKEYYTTTTTGTKRNYIDASLPQWQAAAKQAAFELENSSAPEANYYRDNYKQFRNTDPNFTVDYINTAGGKFHYNRTETSVKHDIHNTGGSDSGDGTNKDNVSSGMGTTTQILRQNTAIPAGELPTQTIANYQARTNQILNSYNTQGYKTDTDTDGFKILLPKPGETIAETSTREAENTTLRLLQQKESNATSIHKALAIKYDLDPSIPLERQLKDPKILEKAQNARYHELNKTTQALPGSGVTVSANNQEGRIKAGNEAYLKVLKQDENFKNYVTDLEALQKGVTESGVLTYPLTDAKQEALRSSAQAALSNPVNYKLGDQGSIEYLQSNDNVSDSDKKEITKYLSKNKDALNGVSSVMWDREKGEYAVLVTIPKEDGSGTVNVKISGDKNLPGLATAARQLDALYYDNDRSVARDKYQEYEEKTDGGNGLLIHPQLPKAIVTTHLPTTENLGNGKVITQGETIFTLPELPNIFLRMKSFDKMYDFLTFYNNPQNANIVKDPQQLLKAARENYMLEDIAVPDKIYSKYEQKIREVKK